MFRSWLHQNYKTSQGSHQNLNMTKSLQRVNNIPSSQHTKMEQNRKRLVVKFSTLKKIERVFGVGKDPKLGKTYMERFAGNDQSGTINRPVYDRYQTYIICDTRL